MNDLMQKTIEDCAAIRANQIAFDMTLLVVQTSQAAAAAVLDVVLRDARESKTLAEFVNRLENGRRKVLGLTCGSKEEADEAVHAGL